MNIAISVIGLIVGACFGYVTAAVLSANGRD